MVEDCRATILLNHAYITKPDTITPGGPQGLNRYSYILNNPVNGIDPTGHTSCFDIPNAQAQAYCESQGGEPGFGDDSGYDGEYVSEMVLNTYPSINAYPTESPTPKPTQTPTMNTTISSWLTATPTGPLPTPAATLTPEIKLKPAIKNTVTKFDAKRMDFVSIGIDAASVATTGFAVPCPATGWACFAAGLAEVSTIAGITYQIGKAQTNMDELKVGGSIFAGLSEYGRAVPVLGVALSIYDLWDQVFNHGFYREDVLLPEK